MSTEKTTAVKDSKNIDQLLIYANYVLRMFDTIFETSEDPDVRTEEKYVSIMFHDLALVYIKHDSGDKPLCVVSYHDNCSPTLVAELCCCLKDIFGINIYVNEETWVQDNVNHGFIWGRERIDIHNEKVWGRKVTHSIWFDDSMAGHS